MESVKNRLREAMEIRGIRQQDLIDNYGFSSSTISQYVSGRNVPKVKAIYRLAKALNVRPDWLAGFNVPMENPKFNPIDRDTIHIPILGTVAAGYNCFAEENYIGELQAEGSLSDCGNELFALQIKGDSMAPRIMEGDTVIVSRTAKVECGDIVIAIVDGEEATCKKLQKFCGGIALVPLNPTYQPAFYSDEQIESLPVKIIGKVIENRQKF